MNNALLTAFANGQTLNHAQLLTMIKQCSKPAEQINLHRLQPQTPQNLAQVKNLADQILAKYADAIKLATPDKPANDSQKRFYDQYAGTLLTQQQLDELYVLRKRKSEIAVKGHQISELLSQTYRKASLENRKALMDTRIEIHKQLMLVQEQIDEIENGTIPKQRIRRIRTTNNQSR